MDDILLINPQTSLSIQNNEPLNLLAIASFLRNNGVSASIYDEISPLFSLRDRVKNIKYVGITSNTCTYPRAVQLTEIIREINPKVRIIAGGVHPTTRPEQAVKDGFDIVVSGEGELALLDILTKDVSEGIVEGKPITEDQLYGLDRDLIDMDFYSRTKQRTPADPNLNFVPWGMKMGCFLTSRGCPFDCIFCHNIWRKTKMRFVPIDVVLTELSTLKNKYGVSAVWFMDDHIFTNKKRSRSLFQSIIDSKLNMIWASAARVDTLDEDLLDLAYQSGCRRLCLGIESGNDRILKILNKRTTVEQNYEAITTCHKHRIQTVSAVMIGNPTETMEEVKDTIRFILTSKTDDIALSILTPFPGTELWRMCEQEGRLPEEIDFADFNYLKAPVRITDHLSTEQLEKLKRDMLLRFYLQPRKFGSMMLKWIQNPKSMYKKIIEYF
jgi:anaerobic magnesium-protoporphyrin IX monomethyl ester cyclase